MTQKHYLLKALGLSGIPKLVTFGLTLLSFPLMIRALGATEYGVVLFIGATLSIFEVLMDFGVSSAAGKAMASIRSEQPADIRIEFFTWARLQIVFGLLGFGPMLAAAYLMLRNNAAFEFEPSLLIVMGSAVGANVALNFIRPNLLSLLAFKPLALLDTFESVVRSIGLMVVATLFPSAISLAWSGLITSVAASTLAVILMRRQLLKWSGLVDNIGCPKNAPHAHMTTQSKIRESANFVWLRLATRLFQEGPLLLVGRLLGPEVVGIIGAMRKVNEIMSTPYLVIGNALMVRAYEVSRRGLAARQALWDAAFRIASTSVIFSAILYLGSDILAQGLLPESEQAPRLFAIMVVLFIPYTVACLIPPMSDYIGGLFFRTLLVTIFGLLQIPILWFSATFYGPAITLTIIVLIYAIMISGYIVITSRLLFHSWLPPIRSEVIRFFSIICIAWTIATQVGRFIPISGLLPILEKYPNGAAIAVFLALSTFGILIHKESRIFYCSTSFFEFEPQLIKGSRES